MNRQDTEIRILQIISESKLAIINFQEELLELKGVLNLNNPEEQEILVSMADDINFIVGTIAVNCIKLEKLLKELEANDNYFSKNSTDINALLTKIEEFNSKVITKK